MFLCGAGLYFAFVNCDDSCKRPERVGIFFIGSSSIASLLALLGTEWNTEKIPFLARISQSLPRLSFGESGFQPDLIAGTMLVLIPVVIASIITSGRRGRKPLMGKMRIQAWVGIGTVGLMIFVLLLTQSRTGILIALVVVGIFSAFRWRILNLIIIASAFTLLILLLLGLVSNHLMEWMIQLDNLGWFGKGLADTWLQRQEIWSNAVKTIRDYPLTGNGLGAFGAVVWHNYSFFNVSIPDGVRDANNLLLQSGVDFGLIGLVGFSWLATVLFLIGWVVRRRQRDDDRILLTGVWLGLLAWMGFGLFNAVSLSTRPAFFVWILMGIIVGNWRRDDIAMLAISKRQIWGTDAAGALIVIGFIVVMLQLPSWPLNQGANLLDRAVINGEPFLSDALDRLDQASELTGAKQRRAFAHYLLGNKEQAMVLFRQNENSDEFLISTSRGYMNVDLDRALEIAHFGLLTFPDSGRLACLLGDAYSLKNENMIAFGYYRKVPSLQRDFDSSPARQAECNYRLGEMQ
ncbi:MAG: O-antigen ligase family protein, partial [Anaerolineales bacterium]|nr:O-antigen ligase family protein [Anaerolineales bacterium]